MSEVQKLKGYDECTKDAVKLAEFYAKKAEKNAKL